MHPTLPAPGKKLSKKPKRPSFFWTFFKACLTLGILGLCGLALLVIWFSYDLPDIQQLQQSNRKPSVVMQTEDGTIIGTYGELHEDMVKLSELPPYVYQAVMAVEDRRFHHHFGLDFIGLVRAAYTNYQADRVVQGGSTLTQQLAKNFLQSQGMYTIADRSFRRKIQEAIMSLWLEWHFTKEQILTIYLNRVYLGAGAFGIDAASHKYFKCSARDLSVYQAAVIAGLLKAPSRYSPLSNPQRAYERARIVLQQMADAGFIQHPEQYLEQAKKGLIEHPETKAQAGIRFFTDWIYEQIPNFVPINQDLIVTTTLDLDVHEQAETTAYEYCDTMGKELKASEIALVSMSPSGAVKAWVGGRDYKKSQFNRVQALRQPGSTFKLFVYLAALESGMSPWTMVNDSPVVIGNWAPSNYKWKTRGEVSIFEAFAHSANAVSVRLGLMVGPGKVMKVAKRLGITSKMTPNISITLGAMDVTLLQLTASLATFANQGMAVWPYGISEIRTRDGYVLYKREPQTTHIIAPQHLKDMNRLLNAVVTIGTGRAAKSAVGGKSGTNGDKDAWFIGYTSKLVTGVWVGNDDGSFMDKKSVGGRMPAQTWEAFNAAILEREREEGGDIDDLIAEFSEPEAESEPKPRVERKSDQAYNPNKNPHHVDGQALDPFFIPDIPATEHISTSNIPQPIPLENIPQVSIAQDLENDTNA